MVDASFPTVREQRERATREALASLFADQQFDVMMARRVLGPDWDKRLARLIYDLNMATATQVGDRVAAALKGAFNPAFMGAWLMAVAENSAQDINDSTRADLADAEDEDSRLSVFDALIGGRAAVYAASMVTTAANFGAQDAARASGAGTKTWISSGSPRHAAMHGETVPLSENFSNGMAWPGDPDGGAGEVANCRCSVEFN